MRYSNIDPDLDCGGSFALAHNGRVPNAGTIVSTFRAEHRIVSATDSEAIVHLIEEEREVHVRDPGPRPLGEGGEAPIQRRRLDDGEVTRVAVDTRAQRLRPGGDGRRAVAVFIDERPRDGAHHPGPGVELREPDGPRGRRRRDRLEGGGDGVERGGQTLSRDCVPRVVGQRAGRLADDERRVFDPGQRRGADQRTPEHLAARVLERDQVAGQISAVDSRDIKRSERGARVLASRPWRRVSRQPSRLPLSTVET